MSLDAPPLTPDPGTARRWLGGELARPTYADRQTWTEIVKDWLNRHVPGAGSVPGGTPVAVILLLLLVVLLAVVVVRAVPRWRSGPTRRSGRTAVLGGTVLSAEEHRRRARAALEAGDHTTAVQESFRAITRGLQERTVLPERDGLTATEVAAAAAVALPSLADGLHRAAGLFNATTYGDLVPSVEHARFVVDLDAAATAGRPVDLPVAAR